MVIYVVLGVTGNQLSSFGPTLAVLALLTVRLAAIRGYFCWRTPCHKNDQFHQYSSWCVGFSSEKRFTLLTLGHTHSPKLHRARAGIQILKKK